MRMYKGVTAQDVTTGVSRGCRYLLLAYCLLAVLPAWGAGGVLVIGDSTRPYFRAFSASLAAGLGRTGTETRVADTEKFDNSMSGNGAFLCIVTVGNDAARALSAKPLPFPVLHALVTDSFSDELSLETNGQPLRSFLLIDQPISRLVLLASSSMPGRTRMGVIYGPHSKHYRNEVRRHAGNAELFLIEKEISEPGQLSEAMASFSSSSEMLLTLPDPVVVNEGTAKTLILGAYLENLPLVGYSQALVKAGALMSVHSTPEQLGTQAAELINATYWNDTRRKVRIYPRYYQVSVNYQVASALQIELPSENDLKSRLERMEGAR
jgi:ABC-type uncharacterized transport system substrate-binding protein